MNLLDGIILIPIAYGVYSGFRQGLVKEVLGLAGFVAGAALAFIFYGDVAPWLAEKLGWSEGLAGWASGILIFIATLSAAHLLAVLIGKLVDLVFLGGINRLLGALFSGIKWALAVSFVMLAATALGFRPGPEMRQGSISYERVERAAPWLLQGIGSVSPSAMEAIGRLRQGMEERLDAVLPPETDDRRNNASDEAPARSPFRGNTSDNDPNTI